MDFNKIKTFVVVAEHNSITTAASYLRRSQSAISQQIQLLESELKMKLLERKGGKIYLSNDGEKVYKMAKENLQKIEDNITLLNKGFQQTQGNIRLGVLNDKANKFNLGRHLGLFSKKFKNISFQIYFGTSRRLEEKLITNEIDMGILVFFKNPEMFIRTSLNKAGHSLYTSKEYIENYGEIKKYKEIISAHLIDLNENFACISTWFRKNSPTLDSTLKHRKPDIIAPNHEVAKEIVKSGIGMAILPDYLVEKECQSGSIVKVIKSSKTIFSGLDIAYRTNKTVKLSEQLFIDFLKENSAN